jgi:two-component system, cell cycle response regulator
MRRQWILGPTVLAFAYAFVWIAGPAFYPLVYLFAAIAASAFAPTAAIFTGMLVVGVESLLYERGVIDASQLAAHLSFTALFAALFATVLRRQMMSIEETKQRAVNEALARVAQDARDFRLIGSTLGPESRSRQPDEVAQARQVGSVRAIRESLVDVLEMARLAVEADDAMIFMLDEAGDRLRLKECVAKQGEPSAIDKPVGASEGALGAVIKTGRAVYMKPRPGNKGLGYKVRREVNSFLGVPISRDGRTAGVLCVDRATHDDFADRDEAVLLSVAREAERAMESERIFAEMDKVKHEQECFYEAFSLLNEALTVDVFAGALIEAVARIKPVDFLVVTMFDKEKLEHTIVGARGAEKITGATFKNRAGGLVVTALKNGHPLPYVPLSAQSAKSKLQIFSPKISVPELASVKVFPLLDRGHPFGALVVGSTIPGKDLTREEERMLETVAVHASRTLANAQMYARMEMMATTDGLTGLVNRRRFTELLGEALARAKRFSRKVSVLMVDADHFKSVNDTYGHPVGDQVLKRIAKVLQQEARRTDVVARYGGEEFVVVLDETDGRGARSVAERIRKQIEREVVQGEFGKVRVTASLGLATWPEAADSMEDLLEHADQALYEAKKNGRNRVEVYGGLSTEAA